MPNLVRAAAAAALLALAGCVGAPAVAPYYASGSGYLGTQCFAGAYVCALPAAGPVGAGCSCPGLGAPSYGVIR